MGIDKDFLRHPHPGIVSRTNFLEGVPLDLEADGVEVVQRKVYVVEKLMEILDMKDVHWSDKGSGAIGPTLDQMRELLLAIADDVGLRHACDKAIRHIEESPLA
jgi:hypothetical protein